MKQNLIWVVAVLCVISLLVASAVSISRAKHLPDLPQEELQEQEQEQEQTQEQTQEPEPEQSQTPEQSEGEETTEQQGGAPDHLIYFEYTGQQHPGTGIAYRGSGANASRVIVIDAGHQIRGMSETEPVGPGASETKAKVTGGTQGSVTGLAEYELNLRVALALRDVLVGQGYTVIMVRETNEVEISNAERAILANEAGADLNIRIHANGDTDASMRGAMMVCQTPNNPYNANIYKACRALAEALLQPYCESTGLPVFRIWETDTMTGINWATVPTAIVEMGFMTNAQDEAIMADEGFAALAAQGLARGIANYFALPTEQETGTQADGSGYTVDLEMEASLGKTFTETNVTMQATGNVNVRTEPSSRAGQATVFAVLKPGDRVTVVGLGDGWNRVLIDGRIYYVSAAYLKEVQ